MNDEVFAHCRWPDLGPKHDRALKSAVAWVLGVTEPLGIVATGTIVRGEAHASSDIDLYVLHEAPYRRRVQRFFEGVPTEIFINSPDAVRSYFETEHRTGRRITAHMLATGFIVLGQESEMERLCDEARSWLELSEVLQGPKADAARYAAATPLEDAADIIESDEVNASLLLHRAVTQMLECRLRLDGRPVPRAKALVAEVTALDPELGRLVRQFTAAGTAAERLEVAHQVSDRTIGVRGFFEWDSGQDPTPPRFVSGTWPDDSPEAAIASYLAATYEERWDDAVDLIQTEAGERHALDRRRFFLERNSREVTPEHYRRRHPDASPEVVEWHVAKAAESRATRPGDWEEAFAGVHNDEELRALDARGLLRALIEAVDLRYRFRITYGALGWPIPDHMVRYMTREPTLHIVGHLLESPDRAIVCYRAGGGPTGEPEVIEMTRHPSGRWQLPPGHRLALQGGKSVFVYAPEPPADESRAGAEPTQD
ncbi:MAG: nucleotidyltransferase domain-containing protein [Cytophagaceae bacterium]|nr:nucleotidyltransferase domain-containing protein [Gemmatimonadaceae bacterium]